MITIRGIPHSTIFRWVIPAQVYVIIKACFFYLLDHTRARQSLRSVHGQCFLITRIHYMGFQVLFDTFW